MGAVETFISILPGVLLAFTVHELMHAWTAERLGDDTGRLTGRLTANPLAHLHPVGTAILLFTALRPGHAVFGWARPVAYNPNRLKNPRLDTALMALSGPMANLALAFLAGLGYRAWGGQGALGEILYQAASINVGLAVFNLVPIPPLDGAKVLAALLPSRWGERFAAWEIRYATVMPFVVLFCLAFVLARPYAAVVDAVFRSTVGSP